MKRDGTFPRPLQAILWAGANSAAGATTGTVVGAFREGGFEPTIILISVLFGNVVGFTVLLSSSVVFPRVRGLSPLLRAALLILTLISGSVAGTALVIFLFPLYVIRDLTQSLAVFGINGVLALIVGAIVYIYEDLRARLAESLREIEEVRLVEAQLKEQAVRAELSALQARINPHFFFNTLNTISSLLADDPGRADDVLQRLAGLFRYTFKASDAGPVTLAEELAFVDDYLEIERARFGDRLRVVHEIVPTALAARVPGLILQPLVENSVAHGIAPRIEGGSVRIAARVEGADLVVEVGDDGQGLKGAAREGEDFSWLIRDGHGLGNVRRRLEALYDRSASIHLLAGPGGRGASVFLRIPAGTTPARFPRNGPPETRAHMASGGS